jgi:hypothetical protein
MNEKWRDIDGYDGVYQVSDLGQVRNPQTSKILHYQIEDRADLHHSV